MSFAQILENIPWENYAFFICSDIKNVCFIMSRVSYGMVLSLESIKCGCTQSIVEL